MIKRYRIPEKSVELEEYSDDFSYLREYKNNASESNETLLSELDNMSPDDIAPPQEKKKLTKKQKTILSLCFATLGLCLAIAIYIVAQIVLTFVAQSKAQELYGDMALEFFSDSAYRPENARNILIEYNNEKITLDISVKRGVTAFDNVSAVKNERFEKAKAKLNSLYIDNEDTFGWITVEGTNINYPIVKAEDNDYYLTHAYDKTPLAVGSIFIDCRNEKKVEKNRNIVIYGHNMLNGSMFCDATKFLEEGFFMNPENDIEITTFDGIYTFRVFSAYPTDKYDNYFKTYFPTGEEFVQFCTDREAKSLYHKEGMTFSPDDVIITLSTCILGNDDGRYAVHAKLIKVEN